MGTRILCGTTDKRWHENTATLTRSALNEEHAQYNWAAIDEESTGYLRDTKAVLTWPGCFAACATFIGIMVSYLRVLRPCVEQGNMLYQLQQEIINHTKG